MPLVTSHTSITRKLSLLIFRAWKVSSGTAITAAIDVSLNSEMKLLPRLGSALRIAIGRMIQSATPVPVSPIERAASRVPFGMIRIAARNDFGQVGAGIDGEHRREGVGVAEADSVLRQREEREEREHEDRHVADEADIERDQRARRPAAEHRRISRDDADQRAGDEPGQSHGEAQREPRQKIVEAAEDRAEVQDVVHASGLRIPERSSASRPGSRPAGRAALRRTIS